MEGDVWPWLPFPHDAFASRRLWTWGQVCAGYPGVFSISFWKETTHDEP